MRAGEQEFTARVRIDTPKEVQYYQHGGILPFVLRQLLERGDGAARGGAPLSSRALMPVPDVLRKLLTAPGPSGYEQAAAAVFRDAAAAFAEVTHDSVGSTVARVKGTAGRAAAGRDRPHRRDRPDRPPHRRRGLPLVQRRRRLGPDHPRRPARRDRHARRRRSPAWSARSRSTCSRRRSASRCPSCATCTSTSAPTTATRRARRVRIGDVAVIAGEPVEYPNGRLVSRSMDNRLGCFVAYEVGAARRRGRRRARRRRAASR